jgi:hypothetical protein
VTLPVIELISTKVSLLTTEFFSTELHRKSTA